MGGVMEYMETPCGRVVEVGDILVFKKSLPSNPKLVMVEKLVYPDEVHLRYFGRDREDWMGMEYNWSILRYYKHLNTET
jgi:hypothetical protein